MDRKNPRHHITLTTYEDEQVRKLADHFRMKPTAAISFIVRDWLLHHMPEEVKECKTEKCQPQ